MALKRALVSLAVPAVTLATAAMLAAPAGAATAKATALRAGTTGPNMYSPMEAGYAATKAAFRFVKADFILPDPTQFASYLTRVEYTVELWSSSRDTVLGVYASTSNTSKTPYRLEGKVYNNKTHALICATWSKAHPCPGVQAGSRWGGSYAVGDKMELSTLFSKSSGRLRFHANDLTLGTAPGSNSYVFDSKIGTAIFGQARIGAEFGCTPWTGCGPHGSLSYTAPPKPLNVIRADDAELSITGTLVAFAGPFVHSKVIMTSNGTSTGTKMAYPANLGQYITDNGVTYKSDSPDGEFHVKLP